MAPKTFKQRLGEHGRSTVRRLLTGLAIPHAVERGLLTLVNSLELAKSQLKGQLAERNQQIRNKQALATGQSDNPTLKLKTQPIDHAMEVKRLKEDLTQALADHELETQRLKDELEQARNGYSGDDDLVKLYHAGAAILAKQAAEIKKLQAKSQNGKHDLER
jgi:regulator of replication initiation timing